MIAFDRQATGQITIRSRFIGIAHCDYIFFMNAGDDALNISCYIVSVTVKIHGFSFFFLV